MIEGSLSHRVNQAREAVARGEQAFVYVRGMLTHFEVTDLGYDGPANSCFKAITIDGFTLLFAVGDLTAVMFGKRPYDG